MFVCVAGKEWINHVHNGGGFLARYRKVVECRHICIVIYGSTVRDL